MAAAAPFALKAAPWIAQGVGALIGKKLSGPSKEQKAAQAGVEKSATGLEGMAQPLQRQGVQYAQQAGQTLAPASQYYRNILSSRRSATESLAPETTTALEYYRGAEGKTKRTMQGGARDTAMAELERQKVGQIAGMLPAARRSAAEGATQVGGTYGQIGTSLTGQATNAAAQAGYLRGGMFDMASRIRDQQGAGGKAWGGFLYDMASSMPWGKGGGGSVIPTRTPNFGMAGATLPSATQNPYYR